MGKRLTLDSKNSWSNLPYAAMPATVGLSLIAFPWVSGVEPSMTAPIMLPFGAVWLVAAICINGYHSELILDEDEARISYRTSLVLHSWANTVCRDDAESVVLSKDGNRHQFVVKTLEGEDLSVTTFDYWRAREWSEQVASFLKVPLVDECRGDEESTPENLLRSLREDGERAARPDDTPAGLEAHWEGERRIKLTLPSRGILPSARPRVAFGAALLLVFLVLPLSSVWYWSLLLAAVVSTVFLWARPLAQATHYEEIEASKHGLLVRVSNFGRTKKYSYSQNDLRSLEAVKEGDARFEKGTFERHGVCIEGLGKHLQVGSHLQTWEQVEWLHQTLRHCLLGDSENPEKDLKR